MALYIQLNDLVILSALLVTTYAIFFYHDNKQRCNCLSNMPCNHDGTCTPDKCAIPYVGVTCQHANMSFLLHSTKQLTIPHVLLDGDDATCLNSTSTIVGPVIYEVYVPYHFIWIYISSKSTISINPHLSLYKGGKNISVQCTILEINEKSLLIKLTDDTMYNKLELYNLPSDTCSVEISLGRNLAVSSTPNQSSVNKLSSIRPMTETAARFAISGIVDTHNEMTWSITQRGRDQWWKTRLLHDAFVNLVVVTIPSNGDYVCSMKDIVLKMFTSHNTQDCHQNYYNSYYSPNGSMRGIFFISECEELVREIEVSIPNASPSRSCPLYGKIAICEIYIFGEFCCPENMYGLLCERHCPGCDQHHCDPDWGCPEGCKQGWVGHWCNTSCMFRYGEKCEFECSEQCEGIGDCDRRTSACLQGCKPGFLPPNCTDPCPPGSFGVNCSRLCDKCKANTSTGIRICEPQHGVCSIGCEDGFDGDHCEKLKVVGITVDNILKYILGTLFAVGLITMFCKSLKSPEEESTSEEEDEEEKSQVDQKRVEAMGEGRVAGSSSTDPEIQQSTNGEDNDEDGDGVGLQNKKVKEQDESSDESDTESLDDGEYDGVVYY